MIRIFLKFKGVRYAETHDLVDYNDSVTEHVTKKVISNFSSKFFKNVNYLDYFDTV